MSYLKIKNWEKFQHYKDRNPPWIKLATDTFQNYDFACLQDASKLLAICYWTLASRSKDGSVPADFDWVKKQCNLGKTITEEHLKELIHKGFIINASNLLAGCKQSASPETEAYSKEAYSKEGETKTESARAKKKITLEELSVAHITDWLNEKRSLGKYLEHDENFILEQFKQYCKAKGKKYADYTQALRNAFEWERCQPNNSKSQSAHDVRGRAWASAIAETTGGKD